MKVLPERAYIPIMNEIIIIYSFFSSAQPFPTCMTVFVCMCVFINKIHTPALTHGFMCYLSDLIKCSVIFSFERLFCISVSFVGCLWMSVCVPPLSISVVYYMNFVSVEGNKQSCVCVYVGSKMAIITWYLSHDRRFCKREKRKVIYLYGKENENEFESNKLR